jgi:hypothetical protein
VLSTLSPLKSRPRAAEPAVSRRFNVHGVPVDLCGSWDLLGPQIDAWLGAFSTTRNELEIAGSQSMLPVTGMLRRYEQREVIRHMSPQAVRLSNPGHDPNTLMELYQDGERFWLVDDRWGMVEINLIKASWRSWLLPKPSLDPVRCVEMALLWPLAQVLRGRGLNLLPAVSMARDGRGVLILGSMGIEAEIAALIGGGFRVIGQRWSCLREKGAAVDLLHMPGQIERARIRGLKGPGAWADIEGEYCGSSQASSSCDTVIIVEPARRTAARIDELANPIALDALRRAWPMAELHRNRRQLALKLATGCRCASVQLSRRPEDLLDLLGHMSGGDQPAMSNPSSRRFVPATIRA